MKIDAEDAIISEGDRYLYGPTFSRDKKRDPDGGRFYKGPEGDGSPVLILNLDSGSISIRRLVFTKRGDIHEHETQARCKKFSPSNVFN